MKKLVLSLLATGLIGLKVGAFADYVFYNEKDIKDVFCSEMTKACYLVLKDDIYNLNHLIEIKILYNGKKALLYFGNIKDRSKDPWEKDFYGVMIDFDSEGKAFNTVKNILMNGNSKYLK